MALQQRKSASTERIECSAHKETTSIRKSRSGLSARGFLVSSIVSIILFSVPFIISNNRRNDHFFKRSSHKLKLSNEADIVFHFSRDSNNGANIGFGPHEAEVQIKSSCANPFFWIRFMDDSLVAVLLKEGNNITWRGQFSFPVAGKYSLETRWYGCGEREASWKPLLSEPFSVEVVDESVANQTRDTIPHQEIFANGAWLSSKSFSVGGISLPEYTWTSPVIKPHKDSFIKTTDERLISKDGVVLPGTDFYRFKDLSNYELVCFIGSKTMEEIRQEFLDMRPSFFPSQRPFKFHFYEIFSFTQPDKHWEESNKQRLRKCKHMLVSVDEIENPVSQSEYRSQVSSFLGHLVKLMNDTTFPIWFFTVNEPPMLAKSCHSPVLPRSSDHPCNDVLKALFDSSVNTFPKRVHLLDNTDISLPQFDGNRRDILANIALRIYVLVGHKVAEWRAAGQLGAIDGLHRNGTVEPNFELIAYEGWK